MVIESYQDLAVQGVAVLALSIGIALTAEPAVKAIMYPLAKKLDTKVPALVEQEYLKKLGREADYEDILKEHKSHYPFPFGKGYNEWSQERLNSLKKEYDISQFEMQRELFPESGY